MRDRPASTERWEASDLAALNAVAEAIAGPISLKSILEALGGVLADRFGVAGGAAFLRTGPDGRLAARLRLPDWIASLGRIREQSPDSPQ